MNICQYWTIDKPELSLTMVKRPCNTHMHVQNSADKEPTLKEIKSETSNSDADYAYQALM